MPRSVCGAVRAHLLEVELLEMRRHAAVHARGEWGGSGRRGGCQRQERSCAHHGGGVCRRTPLSEDLCRRFQPRGLLAGRTARACAQPFASTWSLQLFQVFGTTWCHLISTLRQPELIYVEIK